MTIDGSSRKMSSMRGAINRDDDDDDVLELTDIGRMNTKLCVSDII